MNSSNVRTYYLNQLYTISSGLSKKREEFGFGYPFVTFKDVFNNFFLPINFENLANTTVKERERCSVKKGDVFLTRTSETVNELGMSCVALDDYPNATFNGFTKRLRLKQEFQDYINPVYIGYFLRSNLFRDQINTLAIMTTRASLNNSMIERLEVKIPEVPEQAKIAKILKCLDDKIEVNSRINKTLERMAQEIFKRWFVDFEFPNEDGVPYKSSGGEMVESEQGLIPIGWKVRELGDVMSIHDSKRIPLSKNEREKLDKIYPYYGAASLMDYVDDYIFDGIYVLLGEDGTVINEDGTPVLQYVWGKFWVNNHAHVLTGAIKESTNFLYMLLKKINVRSSVTGAVQLKINQKNLCGIKIILPEDEDLIIKYSNITEKIFEMYRKLNTQNKLLSDTRNTILPKLMSGEIRVPMEEV